MKDKSGKEITAKEFLTRWKQGIKEVSETPQSQIKVKLNASRLMLVGFASGFFVSMFNFSQLWWMGLILSGGFVMTYMQYLGLNQQAKIFKDIEAQIGGEKDGLRNI